MGSPLRMGGHDHMPHTSTSPGQLAGRRRRTFLRLAAVASLATVGLVASAAGPTGADGVPSHDHFQVLANGTRIQIGPHVCDHPEELHEAFHDFHDHVHQGAPRLIGGMTIEVVFC
jgi:hypothetical protein